MMAYTKDGLYYCMYWSLLLYVLVYMIVSTGLYYCMYWSLLLHVLVFIIVCPGLY